MHSIAVWIFLDRVHKAGSAPRACWPRDARKIWKTSKCWRTYVANKKSKGNKSRPIQHAKSRQDLPGPQEDVGHIVEFLEMFRDLTDPRAQHPLKLISIRVPEPLLAAFRFKAERTGVPYQTMIKRLMMEWLKY